MTGRLALLCSGVLIYGMLLGCNNMPGHPPPGPEVPRPDSITSFDTLYNQNCRACHGVDGKNGPAISLSNPTYQAIVDEATLTKWISQGQPGTLMPAFAQSAGGLLTDEQIKAIVTGMRSRWYNASELSGQNAPPYSSEKPGDVQRGHQVYQTYCSRCHQEQRAANQPGPQGSSITDPTYLALISGQTLRTIIIAGRPDLGQPDWRNDVQGKPMTDQEITDAVAWLSSLRIATPGQPYPEHK